MHNHDEAAACAVCRADLTAPREDAPDAAVFLDLSRVPFGMILRPLFRSNPLKRLLGFPFFAAKYYQHKWDKTPFLSLLRNHRTPKLHFVDAAHLPKRHASVDLTMNFLQAQGFEPLCALEDVGSTQGIVQHILAHRERSLYAEVTHNKQTEQMWCVSFVAFFQAHVFLSVSNLPQTLPISFPPNRRVFRLPNASIPQLYQEYLHQVDAMAEPPRRLSLEELLRENYAGEKEYIELGIQQQVFLLKDAPETPAAQPVTLTCSHHPTRAAVRTCSECGAGLCDACYAEFQERVYCERCLPSNAAQASDLPRLAPGDGFAGFAARAVAALLDVALTIAAFVGMFFGFSALLRLIQGAENARALAALLTEVIGSAALIGYLIVPIARYGGTIGQKIVGLRVIDRRGNRPELVAALVRFAYFIISCLFLVPFLGYVFMCFTPKKQGLHDRLAGTYVVTKRPRLKAALAWALLLLLTVGGGWAAYAHRDAWMLAPLFASFAPPAPQKIQLSAKWRHVFDASQREMLSFVNRGDVCIFATSASLSAVEMTTGVTRWENAALGDLIVQPLSENPALPLIAVKYSDSNDTTIMRIDPASGELLWQHEFRGEYRHVTFDAQTLAAYAEQKLDVFDADGAARWSARFQGKAAIAYAHWHSGLLIGRFAGIGEDDERIDITLAYLDRASGQTIWEEPHSECRPRFVVERDAQIFSKKDGSVVMMRVPDRNILWTADAAIGDVVAQDADTLYTMTAAVKKSDGAPRFSYPPGSRFSTLTHDYLLLSLEQQSQKKNFLLIDKITGDTKQYIQNTPWFFAKYLSEDETAIYFAVHLMPNKANLRGIRSNLVTIRKDALDVKELFVGENLGALQLQVFPQERLVFIPSFQSIGGYTLPEM